MQISVISSKEDEESPPHEMIIKDEEHQHQRKFQRESPENCKFNLCSFSGEEFFSSSSYSEIPKLYHHPPNILDDHDALGIN